MKVVPVAFLHIFLFINYLFIYLFIFCVCVQEHNLMEHSAVKLYVYITYIH